MWHYLLFLAVVYVNMSKLRYYKRLMNKNFHFDDYIDAQKNKENEHFKKRLPINVFTYNELCLSNPKQNFCLGTTSCKRKFRKLFLNCNSIIFLEKVSQITNSFDSVAFLMKNKQILSNYEGPGQRATLSQNLNKTKNFWSRDHSRGSAFPSCLPKIADPRK